MTELHNVYTCNGSCYKIMNLSENVQKKCQNVYHFQHCRSESFDDANLSHETQLLELWTLLQPDRPLLKRVTKQWQDIGEYYWHIWVFQWFNLIVKYWLPITRCRPVQVFKARIQKLISEGWEFWVCKISCKNQHDLDDGNMILFSRYFAKQFGTAAKHILSHSHHPKFG